MKQSQKTAHSLPTYHKAVLQTVAHKCIREAVNTVLGRFDLNTTQWMILGMLYESATGLRITDVAKSLQVEVPLITTLGQALLASGLVKNRINVNDRRSKPIALTKKGKELVTTIETELKNSLDFLETGLSEEEVSNYFETLELFIANAESTA